MSEAKAKGPSLKMKILIVALLVIIGALWISQRAGEPEPEKPSPKQPKDTTVYNLKPNPKLNYTLVGWDDVPKLQAGDICYLSNPVTLMPALDPKDVTGALGQVKEVPAGFLFHIEQVAKKNNTPWYQVKILKMGEENPVSNGWINSNILRQQKKLTKITVKP